MDSTNTLSQVAEGSNAVLEVNQLMDAASPSMLYGRNADECVDLTFAWFGGRWGGHLTANDAETLTALATHYMVVAKADGAVSFATATTNWNDSTNYCRAYKITTDTSVVSSYEDHRAGPGGTVSNSGGGGGGGSSSTVCIPIAASDETTALTTGTAKVTFRMPFAMTGVTVRASLTTAATGAALQVDINEGGTSILSTKLTVDAGEKTSTTAATPAVVSDTSLADDAEITIDIDVVGSTVAGAGLKVYLIGTV